ncbi:MAG: phosphoglycerate dehydrogenase [Longimicrobiales bacterium]
MTVGSVSADIRSRAPDALSLPKDQIRVLLLEGIHESAAEAFGAEGYQSVERIGSALDGPEFQERIRDVHMVGIRSRTQLTPEVLAAADRLFAVGCFSVGTNQVDLGAAAAIGVPVFNAPHANTRSVAELVIGVTIMLLRDIYRRSGEAHAGGWLKTAQGSREVRGKTLGIVGYGHIGSQVSVLAEGLGMNVVFHDIVPKLPLGNAVSAESLADLLARSDVVTIHVPETPLTDRLFDKSALEGMKRGSHLINTSRGTVVDLIALGTQLKAGHLAGAAVDVFPKEPATPTESLETPLQGLPNVILTPHIGGSTLEAQRNIGSEVARKLAHYSDRGTTTGAVNFPELNLAPHDVSHRILHIHRNVPGVLRQINRIFADAGVNILGQHLQTRGELGYVVLDVGPAGSLDLLEEVKGIEGTIRARILY